jgi:predicted PurR-regulated permease PerM
MSYLQEKSFQFWVFIGIAFIAFLYLFNGILAPFVVGFAVAYLLNPIVQNMANKKIPRWLSAIVILGFFFIAVILGLLLAIPLLVREMIDFIKLLPVAFANGQEWVETTFPMIEIPQNVDDLKNMDTSNLSDNLSPFLQAGKNILGNVFASGMAVIGFLSFIVLMPIVAFYLLIDWSRLSNKVDDLVPTKNQSKIKNILGDIDKSLAGFIRGQLMVCLILGGFYAIALSLMGLQYGFFVGIASGVLSIIPFVGSAFGLIASVGLAFYQFGGWEYPAIALGIFVVGQVVEGNYLTPKLVGESVGLHPLWVIFALMAGGMILGLTGMIIAVPVAAIIAILIRYAIIDYKDSAYYKGKAKKTE